MVVLYDSLGELLNDEHTERTIEQKVTGKIETYFQMLDSNVVQKQVTLKQVIKKNIFLKTLDYQIESFFMENFLYKK